MADERVEIRRGDIANFAGALLEYLKGNEIDSADKIVSREEPLNGGRVSMGHGTSSQWGFRSGYKFVRYTQGNRHLIEIDFPDEHARPTLSVFCCDDFEKAGYKPFELEGVTLNSRQVKNFDRDFSLCLAELEWLSKL